MIEVALDRDRILCLQQRKLEKYTCLGGVQIPGGYGPDLVVIDLSVASHHPARHPGGANHDHTLHDRSLDGLERRAGHIAVAHAGHELARVGARKMLKKALEREVAQYIEDHRDEVDEQDRRLVVRNGHAQSRKVTCGAGTLEVRAPRVDDKRIDENGERQRFTSKILPPYMRRSPKVAEVLPILYLRGLSTGDFREALPVLLGEDAAGLSATNIVRLTAEWEQEYQQFRRRDLSERDYVYVWVDGIHFNIRLEDDRLCTLVMIGARPDGTKELIAVEDGYRESTESWASLLRDLQRQGMRAPVVAVGDAALGFWAAVRDVWPETKEQRDWCHKMGNVLDKLPKRLQPKAKRALREMMYAETREQADEHIDRFITDYQAKYPKAAECLDKDRAALTRHYDFPAEHWKHLRTTVSCHTHLDQLGE